MLMGGFGFEFGSQTQKLTDPRDPEHCKTVHIHKEPDIEYQYSHLCDEDAAL
jgi:hypothetical protein